MVVKMVLPDQANFANKFTDILHGIFVSVGLLVEGPEI